MNVWKKSAFAPVSDTPWVVRPSGDCSISLEGWMKEGVFTLPRWYDPPWAEIEMVSDSMLPLWPAWE